MGAPCFSLCGPPQLVLFPGCIPRCDFLLGSHLELYARLLQMFECHYLFKVRPLLRKTHPHTGSDRPESLLYSSTSHEARVSDWVVLTRPRVIYWDVVSSFLNRVNNYKELNGLSALWLFGTYLEVYLAPCIRFIPVILGLSLNLIFSAGSPFCLPSFLYFCTGILPLWFPLIHLSSCVPFLMVVFQLFFVSGKSPTAVRIAEPQPMQSASCLVFPRIRPMVRRINRTWCVTLQNFIPFSDRGLAVMTST